MLKYPDALLHSPLFSLANDWAETKTKKRIMKAHVEGDGI